MKKKLISLLLTLMLLLSIMPTAFAASSGTAGDGMGWVYGNDGTLTLTGSGQMENHAPAGGDAWGSWVLKNVGVTMGKNILSVKLSSGITRIGDAAFASCRNLTDVEIPVTVTEIGRWAFLNCDSLTDVYYGGTEAQWNQISILSFNESLTDANIHFMGASAEEPPVPDANGNYFVDVVEGAYFYNPVLWAVENNITTGTSATTFSPDSTCTRGQVVTFLWRAAGEPEPASAKNPFVDVKSTDYFYKAVLWAVEQGITTGLDAAHFGSDSPCTRAQVATFLWRANGEPDAAVRNPFADVRSGDYFYEAVLWAVESEVTTGTSASAFSPDTSCTRGQIVTFLYRAAE